MVQINLSVDAEETLKRAFGSDLDRSALEALVIEGYRSGRLSIGEVTRVLGLATSIEGLQWLGRRGIPMNYSLEDLEEDRRTLSKLFPDTPI